MRTLYLSLAASAAALALAAPASAITSLIFTTPTSAIFFDSPTATSFSDVFDLNGSPFGALAAGQRIKISISGTGAGTLTLADVMFNGTTVPITVNGTGPTGNLSARTAALGMANTLSVAGSTVGTGGYTGTIALSAVPEMATWAMMVLGFGAVGASIRQRRRALAAA